MDFLALNCNLFIVLIRYSHNINHKLLDVLLYLKTAHSYNIYFAIHNKNVDCLLIIAEQVILFPLFRSINCISVCNTFSTIDMYVVYEGLFLMKGCCVWRYNVVPIVMGAHPQDYARIAPSNSFIHVDWFSSPAHLAQFLLSVNASSSRYNWFHRWRDDAPAPTPTSPTSETSPAGRESAGRESAPRVDVPQWLRRAGDFYCRICVFAPWLLLEGERHIEDVEGWWRHRDGQTNESASAANLCIGKGRWVPPLNHSLFM